MSQSTHRLAEVIADHIVELSQTRLVEMVASYRTLKRANEELQYITGITQFFSSKEELAEFERLIRLPSRKLVAREVREFGDFQTPPNLAHQICQYLAQNGVSPSVVIEPTYGMGNFVLAALDIFPRLKTFYGVELQERYMWHLKVALLIRALLGRRTGAGIELYRDNIFKHEFPGLIKGEESLLILGNPPWVTSAALGALESENLPQKENLKALNGLDALTGKSNFDIAEYILIRLLDIFASQKGTLAMLVKNSTARNIVEFLPKMNYPLKRMRMLEIDAAREFGVAVDACLFVAELGADIPEQTCEIATLREPKQVTRVFGWVGSNFASNVETYKSNLQFEGKSVLIWRQGLKHDCARVMELKVHGDKVRNGNQELVEIETEYLYGLLKSSDLRQFEASPPHRRVIVTQRRLGEDTSALRTKAPRLWEYLTENGQCLDERRSSIYRGKPRFSIFGVGEYSFKLYKVAISGLYKEPNFSIVCPLDSRPVLLDDTCYFVGFDSYLDALITATIFNGDSIKEFLKSIVFGDAKRPYTKQMLMRVNIATVVKNLSVDSLYSHWNNIGYEPRITVKDSDFADYKERLLHAHPSENLLQLTYSV